jgi:hypothetical protein
MSTTQFTTGRKYDFHLCIFFIIIFDIFEFDEFLNKLFIEIFANVNPFRKILHIFLI